jgi:hypothetical protein
MLNIGTKQSGEINSLAVEVTKGVGIDISNQKSKDITEDIVGNSQ